MELRVIDLSKSFKTKKAVDEVAFKLEKGIHGLLGANGSGKTTLLRMLCGLLPLDKGNILYDGADALASYATYVSKLGYMPQHFGYYPNHSVYEFLIYMSVLKGMNKEEGKTKVNSLIQSLNLQEQSKKKMKHLSGGMLKRVGIAQALLNDPEILILDEPTAGLDPKERIVFRNLIASLSEQCIVILSTHIVSDIESIADDVLVMKEGKIILHDECQKLLDTMANKVWKVNVSKKEAEQLILKYTIVNSHNQGSESELRIVSDEKPHQQAVSVEADLDDLYLYYFQEGESLCLE